MLREDDADAVFLEELIECVLAQTVAFTCQASHAVAVHGMAETAFRGHNHYLARLSSLDSEPLNAEGERHEAVAIGV